MHSSDPYHRGDTEIVEEEEVVRGPDGERVVTRRGASPASGERRRTIIERAPWSIAQAVAIVIGIVFLALGGIALARGGFEDMFAHVQVGGLHHTSLLGLIQLVFGVLMIMAGAIPGADRGIMSFLGALALGAGVVFVIAPEAFHDWLGVHAANGWLYITTGIIALLVALVAPVFVGTERIFRR